MKTNISRVTLNTFTAVKGRDKILRLKKYNVSEDYKRQSAKKKKEVKQ